MRTDDRGFYYLTAACGAFALAGTNLWIIFRAIVSGGVQIAVYSVGDAVPGGIFFRAVLWLILAGILTRNWRRLAAKRSDGPPVAGSGAVVDGRPFLQPQYVFFVLGVALLGLSAGRYRGVSVFANELTRDSWLFIKGGDPDRFASVIAVVDREMKNDALTILGISLASLATGFYANRHFKGEPTKPWNRILGYFAFASAISLFSMPHYFTTIRFGPSKIQNSPNQPPLRTPGSVTPAADAPVAPPPGAAGR
jgi:hypothetical protein